MQAASEERDCALIMLEDSNWWEPGDESPVSPANLLVPLKLGGEIINFLLDTRATYLVVINCKGPLSKVKILIIRVTGKQTLRPFLQPMDCEIEGKVSMHQFLYMLACPFCLLGRDLLCKLHMQVTFSTIRIKVRIPPENKWPIFFFFLLTKTKTEESQQVPQEVLNTVFSFVWAGKQPGRAKNALPVQTELKAGAIPIRVSQYPVSLTARKRLELLTDNFLFYRLIHECQSSFNTLILPLKKPNSSKHKVVQDVWAINKITEDIQPVMTNPYTLLTTLSKRDSYFTELDLKDAFFYIPLEPDSQTILINN